MSEDNRDQVRYTSTGLVPGIIVAGLGVLFLLNNLHILRVYNWWLLWPVVLIAIGMTKLIDSPHHNERTGGAILVVIGGIFLGTNFGFLPWRIWAWWPVLLIGAGLMMLLNRTQAGCIAGIRVRPLTGKSADGVAVFGGFKRQISSTDFRGASYVAFCGGGEIDLRRAGMQSETAIIDVTAVCGGFEIKVPTTWLVANELVGIFGGASDETLQPDPHEPGVKRLIVRGTALFGGVAVKN
jgi:predicted membrane protein